MKKGKCIYMFQQMMCDVRSVFNKILVTSFWILASQREIPGSFRKLGVANYEYPASSIKHPVSSLFYRVSQAITFIDTTFSQFVYINYCVNELRPEGSRLWQAELQIMKR